MRGGVGTALLMMLAAGGLLLLGGSLLVVPGRTTRLLNDAFVIVPRVDGRYGALRRTVAMLVGVAVLGYGAYLCYDFVRASVFVYDTAGRN